MWAAGEQGSVLENRPGLETHGTFIVENYDSIRFASFHALTQKHSAPFVSGIRNTAFPENSLRLRLWRFCDSFVIRLCVRFIYRTLIRCLPFQKTLSRKQA